MSRFRGIDADGDWQFGAGLQSYFTDEDAIAADIKTALRLFLGEVFFDLTAGVDWWNLLSSRGKDVDQSIILQCRQVVSSREGVTRINRVESILDRDTRRLSVRFDVDTVFTRNLNGEVVVP